MSVRACAAASACHRQIRVGAVGPASTAVLRAAKPGSGYEQPSAVTSGSSSRGIPPGAIANERERQEQRDRADAERRERDRQAEAIRQQAGEKRRKADEDRKLLESMPPQLWAGAEAARRAEGDRPRASARADDVADGT